MWEFPLLSDTAVLVWTNLQQTDRKAAVEEESHSVPMKQISFFFSNLLLILSGIFNVIEKNFTVTLYRCYLNLADIRSQVRARPPYVVFLIHLHTDYDAFQIQIAS